MGLIELFLILLLIVLIVQYIAPRLGIDRQLAGIILVVLLLAFLFHRGGRIHW